LFVSFRINKICILPVSEFNAFDVCSGGCCCLDKEQNGSSILLAKGVTQKFIYLWCLKKLTAILLLAIHLFNTSGYTFLFQYFINKSETRLICQLDNNKYDEADLVIIKTPLNLPYYNSNTSAERIDGEIEISGIHYNYVKRRVSNDTLYLYCIPNTDKTKLSLAQKEYSGKVTDTQPDTKKDNSVLKKMKWGAEYSDILSRYTYNNLEDSPAQEAGFLIHTAPSPVLASPYKPPKIA
jgi:hypothetical protein